MRRDPGAMVGEVKQQNFVYDVSDASFVAFASLALVVVVRRRRLRRRRSSRRSSRSSPPTTERPLRRRARSRRKTRYRISPYQSPRRRLPPRLPLQSTTRGQALEGKRVRARGFFSSEVSVFSVFVASFVSSSPPPASRAWKVRRASSSSHSASGRAARTAGARGRRSPRRATARGARCSTASLSLYRERKTLSSPSVAVRRRRG